MRCLILVALALPLPAAAQVALPMQTVVPDGTLLDVTAVGKTTRTPDIATINAGVVTQAPTAAAALGENATRMARVAAALKAAGVAPRDIATANVGLSPQYKYGDNQPPVVTGYQATNSVEVRFRDVSKAGRVLDTLVREGANQISGPAMTLDQPDAALDEARADAVKRARARADLYARAAGMSVARVVSIDESSENDGSNPPPMPFRARGIVATAQMADTQISAGEADVTATLRVRFLLK